jgi:C4-dicarboxylate-specific signal transduction histidine kinase
VGGYLYYASLQEAAFLEAERQALNRLVAIKRNLSVFLSENVKPVRVLAGMKEIRQSLVGPDASALAQANAMLDHFQRTLDAEGCYLMDRTGNTIAPSNRQAADSFVGVNFAFRPYFQQALQGMTSTYLAIGITSWRRMAYYSHPVYGKKPGNPLGVVVIKAASEHIEEELVAAYDEVILVADPQGIVFISSHKDWLNHAIKKLSSEEESRVVRSLQFGEGP